MTLGQHLLIFYLSRSGLLKRQNRKHFYDSQGFFSKFPTRLPLPFYIGVPRESPPEFPSGVPPDVPLLSCLCFFLACLLVTLFLYFFPLSLLSFLVHLLACLFFLPILKMYFFFIYGWRQKSRANNLIVSILIYQSFKT